MEIRRCQKTRPPRTKNNVFSSHFVSDCQPYKIEWLFGAVWRQMSPEACPYCSNYFLYEKYIDQQNLFDNKASIANKHGVGLLDLTCGYHGIRRRATQGDAMAIRHSDANLSALLLSQRSMNVVSVRPSFATTNLQSSVCVRLFPFCHGDAHGPSQWCCNNTHVYLLILTAHRYVFSFWQQTYTGRSARRFNVTVLTEQYMSYPHVVKGVLEIVYIRPSVVTLLLDKYDNI